MKSASRRSAYFSVVWVRLACLSEAPRRIAPVRSFSVRSTPFSLASVRSAQRRSSGSWAPWVKSLPRRSAPSPGLHGPVAAWAGENMVPDNAKIAAMSVRGMERRTGASFKAAPIVSVDHCILLDTRLHFQPCIFSTA